MNTQSPAGHQLSVDLPKLSDYSPGELAQAEAWPAIARYLTLIRRASANPSDQLRLSRHELWLRCALATFFERKPAIDVCRFWSQAAEQLIAQAWIDSKCEQEPLALLALGKLGAEELNLSSDVDLILVRADGSAPDVKRTREFQTLLAEATGFGFCLRLDFDLRPGGRSSSITPSYSEFENHYGYHGEMWERLAYVRMRVLQGPAPLKTDITTFARKFSFRKHLDYTLLDELRSLRTKIRHEKQESRPGLFHLKLGEGGIRELELFVHALQVIHGGRSVKLQTHSTTQALAQIKEAGLLPNDECDFLTDAYWYLRTLENRLHAFEDQQTYTVDLLREHAALPSDFAAHLVPLCARVSSIATSLFGETELSTGFPDNPEAQQKWLGDHGFSIESCQETWPALLSATALSRKSERDEQARQFFLKGFVAKLAENKLDRDLGLSLLLDFVKSVRAKASFFTLLNRETRVRDEFATLFSISPYLSSILTSRPELIDEYIFRKQADLPSDFGALLDELAERRLLAELISASQFLTDRDLRKLSLNLTANADLISQELLRAVIQDSGSSSLQILPLGKWGGRELGLRSDLDFIFLSRGEPLPEDHRVAKRFLARITEPHRGGAIYSVDMRLRPSGQAGPIMVRADELSRYLTEDAAAWERQAYLRARPLLDLGFRPGEIASARGLTAHDLDELRMIRSKLFTSGTAGEIDLKLNIGGLADVEFCAQIALLDRKEFSLDPSTSGMIQYLEGVDERWRSVGAELREAYDALRSVEQLFQLTTRLSGSKMRVKSDEFRRLALVLDQSASDLEAMLRARFVRVEELLRGVRIL